MRETYRKHNHNQKGDFTKPDKTRYLRHHCLIADYMKIIGDTTGLFERLADPKLDVLDKRTKNIEYSFHFIVTVVALACCLGIFTVSTFGSAFIEPVALENVSYLTHEDTSRVIDYQAISDALSKIDYVSWMEGLAQDICEKMHRSGRYRKYYKWYGLPVVIDGTDFAFFRSFHCIHDLTATFHKGAKEEKTYYFHRALVAHMFFTKTVSFPIGIEFIENKEQNPSKQDCENQAAIRLLERIKRRFPLMQFIICADSLYANKTFIHLCIGYSWNYLFTLKEGSQPSLCSEFDSMKQQGLTGHAKVRYDTETGIIYWANDMGLIVNDSLPMNILRYQTTRTVVKGKKKARGIQNAVLRRKDINQNMPELSKDQSKYNLDERKPSKKIQDRVNDSARKAAKSEKAKEDLSQINAGLASEIGDGEISGGNIEEGATIEISFMYITNIHISKENVGDLLVRGRMRWMIEEAFLREKTGPQRLEHLRAKDTKVMKSYFWMECIADSCMQIYLDNSIALKVFGSEEEVYRKLRESFEKDSLEDNYDAGRECHWHYDDDRNAYPTVEILPDDEPEKTEQKQDEQVEISRSSADKGIVSEKKSLSETAEVPEEDKTDKNMLRGSCSAPEAPEANIEVPSQPEGEKASEGKSETVRVASDVINSSNDAKSADAPKHKGRESADTDSSVVKCKAKKKVSAGKDDEECTGEEGTGPRSEQVRCHGEPATISGMEGLPADGWNFINSPGGGPKPLHGPSRTPDLLMGPLCLTG